LRGSHFPEIALFLQQDAKKLPKTVDGHLILLRSTASSLLWFNGRVSNQLTGYWLMLFQSS
jgi:hypothetical protein